MKASTPDKTHRFQPQPSFPPDPGPMLVETGLDATRSATTFTVNAGGTPADSQLTLLTELLMVGPPAKIEETLAAKLRPSPYVID